MTQGILLGKERRALMGRKGWSKEEGAKKRMGKWLLPQQKRRGLFSILVMAHCTQSQIEFSEEKEEEEGSSGCELKRGSERRESDMMSAKFCEAIATNQHHKQATSPFYCRL